MANERSDLEQASREAGIYAYSRVAGSLIGFVAIILGARLYSTAEMAFLVALITYYEVAMALGSLGLADAVLYFIGRNREAAPAIVRQSSILLLAVAIPVIAVVVSIGSLVDAEVDITPALPWLAIVLAIELPTQPAVNQLIASGRARFASGVFVGFSAMRTVSFLIPGIVGLGIEIVPPLMAAASVLRLLVYLGLVRRYFPAGPLRQRDWMRWDQLRPILYFAIPAGAGTIAGRLNPQIDKLAVQFWLGEEALANYGVAAYELPLITLVPYAIAAVMQVRYVRLHTSGNLDGLRALWFATCKKTMLIVLPLATMLIALGPEAVIAIGGYKYADAALPFQIFTLVILHRVAGYGAMLQAIGQTRSLLVSSAILLATNVVFTYPLTRLFGYPGPAMASVVAVFPCWMFILSRIGAVLGGGIRGALPWGAYARVLALSAALGVVTWLGIGELPLRAGFRLAIGAVAYLTMFILIGRALGLIARGDLRYVWHWLTLRMLEK